MCIISFFFVAVSVFLRVFPVNCAGNEYASVNLGHNAGLFFIYLWETVCERGNKEERVLCNQRCYSEGSHLKTWTHRTHAPSPPSDTHTHSRTHSSGRPAQGFTVGGQRLRENGAGWSASLACREIIESDRWACGAGRDTYKIFNPVLIQKGRGIRRQSWVLDLTNNVLFILLLISAWYLCKALMKWKVSFRSFNPVSTC